MIFDNFNKLKDKLPSEGRLMAIDVGTKRIGIAISDKSRIIATPKETIKRKSNANDFAKIKEIIVENYIKAIVVGLPLNMDDSENEMTVFAKNFAKNLDIFLENKFNICFQDERLTSFIVKDDLLNANVFGKKNKKNKVVDQMAASLILSSVLSS